MEKALLALDCSIHSRRVVEYASRVLGLLPDCEVFLFTVRTGVPYGEEAVSEMLPGVSLPELHGGDDHDRENAQSDAFLQEMARLLEEGGVAQERIKIRSRILTRGVSQDIIDEAGTLGCDTIILGRRGLSRVRDLLLGSVSREVIQQASGRTVWVVE